MASSRAIGVKGERDVAVYFRQFPEWPNARRRVAAGWRNAHTQHQDQGDLADVEPFCVQVKRLSRPLVGKLLTDTWHETCAQAVAGNRHPIIVERRVGHADVGRWWTHLSSRFYVMLLTGREQLVLSEHLVRVELGDLIHDLRQWARDHS